VAPPASGLVSVCPRCWLLVELALRELGAPQRLGPPELGAQAATLREAEAVRAPPLPGLPAQMELVDLEQAEAVELAAPT
jgi:hypothetical protein